MKQLRCLIAGCTLALPLFHPYGPVRQQHATAFTVGVQENSQHVRAVLERACQNCHSQQTTWPAYSYLPVVSWALERDVAEARRHMDLSRWDRYSTEQKQDLMARIGTEARNRQMPPRRYVLLHPEARLSESEIQAIYDWTKVQRRPAKSAGIEPDLGKSYVMDLPHGLRHNDCVPTGPSTERHARRKNCNGLSHETGSF